MELLEAIWVCTKIGVGITFIGATLYWTVKYNKMLRELLSGLGD